MQLYLLFILTGLAGASLVHQTERKLRKERNTRGKFSSKNATSPVVQVVTLLGDLKRTVEIDGENETTAYDKYACWCEDTLKAKAAEIAQGKIDASTLQTSITKLGGQLASVTADIKQLKVDLADNAKAQYDTGKIRYDENNAFLVARAEAERCISSLEGAINSLAGAGKPGLLQETSGGPAGLLQESSGFLATATAKQIQEAQAISSLGSLREVLSKPQLTALASDSDLAKLRAFVQVGSESSAPGGDYAPASEAIQGILKGMYDGFTTNLEKDSAEEATKQKAYQKLKATQETEAMIFDQTLRTSMADKAAKAYQLSTTKIDLAAVKKTLASNEKFFASTKEACRNKAVAWNERTRLRTEELQGFTAAIEILNSSDAQSTFHDAANSFMQNSQALLQLSPGAGNAMFLQVSAAHAASVKASEQEQTMDELSLGGHFDKIAGHLGAIDQMVKQLHKESRADVDLKNSCEIRKKQNEDDLDDVQTLIRQMNLRIQFLEYDRNNLTTKIAKRNASMNESRRTINEMKADRLQAMNQHEKATNDDLASIALLKKATAALNKFYETNDIKKTNLVEDTPAGVSEEGYGGKKSESGGIVAIIEMITSDLEGEVKDGNREEAEAEKHYVEDRDAAEAAFKMLKDERAQAIVHRAAINRKLAQYNDQDMPLLQEENANLENVRAALAQECIFLVNQVTRIVNGHLVMKTEFQDRIDNRASEEKGLIEAKAFLNAATVLK